MYLQYEMSTLYMYGMMIEMEVHTTIIDAGDICKGIEGVEVRTFDVAASGRGQGKKGAVYSKNYHIYFDERQRDKIIEAIALKKEQLPENTYRHIKAAHTRLMKVIASAK